MANRYWVGGTGNWDATTTTHWSATSGGAGGQSVPTSSDDVIFDSASNATAYTVTVTAIANCANFTMGNPLSGVITFAGSSNLNVYGNFAWATGMTRTYSGETHFKASSGTQNITSNGIDFGLYVMFENAGTRKLIDQFIFNGNGGWYFSAGTFDANGQTVLITYINGYIKATVTPTFYNLTVTPTTPSKTGSFLVQGNIIISNLFTVSSGATVTNRVLVNSYSSGTPCTITAASVSISNADFKDVTGDGAASWDLSAASGGSGNCGGNSMKALGDAAFTTAVDQHWTSASSGSWSLNTNWTSRVPLPQDDVFMNKAFGTSQTVTADMPRLGKSIDWTGATWTTALTFKSYSTVTLFGSLILISGLTWSSNGGNNFTFSGRNNFIINTFGAGYDGSITVDAPTGILQLLSNVSLTSKNYGIIIVAGTFDCNNFDLNCGRIFNVASGVTILLGSGTLSVEDSGGTPTFYVSTGATLNANTSTIKFIDTNNSNASFSGGGKIYNNLWFSRGTSTGAITIKGNNTFADFKDDGTVAHSILFTAGTTQHFTTFTVSGTAGQLITLNSTTTGIYNFILDGGGTVSRDYLNIQHCVATPDKNWKAGTNSINNQDTATAGSGWIFPFTNPANIYASDNTYATLAATSGILTVEVSKDAGANWLVAKTVTFGASDTLETVSGSTELWGSSFTRADMVDANFRIRLSQGNISQVYKTFGFSTGTDILTGIEIAIEGNYVAGGGATNTAATSPGTMADDATVGTVAWSDPDNAKVSDTSYATASIDSSFSHYLKATNFGFSIPTGATINGILMEFDRAGSGVSDKYIRIVKSDGTIGTTERAKSAGTGGDWNTGFGIYRVYGSSTDLWGEVWTAADINDVDFGVAVSAQAMGFDPPYTASVDHIRITVYYTPADMFLDLLEVKIHYGTSILPVQAGSQAFASNGRKAGEGAGAGTGVLVFYDGNNWIASDSGGTVAA